MTQGQFEALFEQAEKRKADEYKFLASLHGFEMKSDQLRVSGKTKAQDGGQKYDNEFNYNGDPKSVAHLPMEVREEMTRKMMGKFKQELG